MRRVPLDVAAQIAEVSKHAIVAWRKRGHIRRYHDGYDIQEILDRLDSRHPAMVEGAKKATASRIAKGAREPVPSTQQHNCLHDQSTATR